MKVTREMVQIANCRLMGFIAPRTTKKSAELFDKIRAMPKMSAADLFEQKVSFVFGQLGANSKLTKDEVRDVLRAQQGHL